MNTIIRKEQLAEKIFLFEVEAPLIAKSAKAGNFVIIRIGDKGERMPLAIADSDKEKGTITLVVQRVGVTSAKLCEHKQGDKITDVVGPLGNAVEIENFGTVMCVGKGIGVATVLPIIKALKQAGNRVLSVISAKSKDQVILEQTVKEFSDEMIITTDDGTLGKQGDATVGMQTFIANEKIDKAFAMGTVAMMRDCCELTRKHNIPTDVALNTIMVDGLGMCGACRMSIDGKTKFVCVDGPSFDGHKVDWDDMLKRMDTFSQEEKEAMKRYEQKTDIKTNQPKTQTKKEDITMDVTPTQETLEELTNRDSEWRKELRASMKNPQRIAIERTVMDELDVNYRIHTFDEEVNLGFTKEQAMREARRCLDCPNPGCVEGCPVHINIPSFIKNIERGQFLAASKVLKNTSVLSAVCGRVCPQEKQCESKCIHHKMKSKPVSIGNLERFTADFVRQSGLAPKQTKAPSNDIKVAAIGSGPAGLSFAGDMAKKGYEVYVFEALHEIGGVLKYGIPEFCLPNYVVDYEIENLKDLGVHFVTDCVIGKTITVKDLEEQGFKGIFVGTGAGVSNFMNIPGENALNIMSSNEYLTRVNLMGAADVTADTPMNTAKHVLVVGGGNTAMDSCRAAVRFGSKVTIVYRRSEAEMPARLEEVRHAKEEGVEFLTLHNPIEYKTDEKGAVKQAVLQVMELGEPDASGRRRPVPVEGKTITLDVDQVIVAVGVSQSTIAPKSIDGLELDKYNCIVVDDKMKSSKPNIYAGGDIVRGGATVILAMGDGRRAAANMDEQLSDCK